MERAGRVGFFPGLRGRGRRAGPGRRWLAGVLACGLALAGCDGAGPDPAEESAAPGPQAASSESPAGADEVAFRDGRVWLVAHEAVPGRLLWRLSEAAGLTLEASALDPTPVSLDFQGAELPVVVAALAGDLPFALAYDIDAASGRHRAVALRVGLPAETAAPPPIPPARLRRAARGDSARRPPPERDREARRELEREPEYQELMRELNVANVDARSELVAELEPVGVELEVLAHLLREDPEPEIRAQAADAIASAGSYGAVRSLVAALDEEDPEVLLQVVDALEFAGDETVVRDLEPLLEHPDPEVRLAAREAIEFLE